MTTVRVIVLDPRTGLDAAECAVEQVPGELADDTVGWCLQAVAGQLVRSRGAADARRLSSSAAPGV